jgi:hypothetical protein
MLTCMSCRIIHYAHACFPCMLLIRLNCSPHCQPEASWHTASPFSRRTRQREFQRVVNPNTTEDINIGVTPLRPFYVRASFTRATNVCVPRPSLLATRKAHLHRRCHYRPPSHFWEKPRQSNFTAWYRQDTRASCSKAARAVPR